jgi:hypothetical protein
MTSERRQHEIGISNASPSLLMSFTVFTILFGAAHQYSSLSNILTTSSPLPACTTSISSLLIFLLSRVAAGGWLLMLVLKEKNGERHEKKNSRTDPTDPKMLGRWASEGYCGVVVCLFVYLLSTPSTIRSGSYYSLNKPVCGLDRR